TAESVNCTTTDPNPGAGSSEQASLHLIPVVNAQTTGSPSSALPAQTTSYTKFTSQEALGDFLVQHYNIRSPRDLSSCEVCHR
ncbi:MAG: molecular chaperone, partial [Silvibacterium sp.]